MPPSQKKRDQISAQDYWAIINFMLLAHGVEVPEVGVTEENAHLVKL